MKSVVITLLVLILAGGQALSDGEGEIVDVSGLIRGVRDQRAPRLGIEKLRSGVSGRGYDEADQDTAGSIPILDFAEMVDCGVGHAGAAFGLGQNLLLLDPRLVPFSRECLRSFAADLARAVRIEVTATGPNGWKSRGEILVRPGRWGTLCQVRSHSLVFDFDVELACDNSGGYFPCVVGDPVVGAGLTGFAVEVRPFLVDGGRAVALEAHIQSERLTAVDTVLTGARYLGAIELPTARTVTLLVSGTVAPGEPVITSLLTPEGEVVIRLVPHLMGAASTGKLRLLDAGLALLGPARAELSGNFENPVDRQWTLDAATERVVPGKPLRTEDEVETQVTPRDEGRTGFVWPIAGNLVTAGSEAFQQAAAEKLARALEPLSRTVQFDFTLRSGDEVVGRAVLSALDGRMAFLRVGTDQNLIRDHDVEVGCYVQIADPIVSPVFSGWLLSATPRIAPDGKSIMLTLDTRIQGLGAKPVRRELGEDVCGSLQLITMPAGEIVSDLVLTVGETTSLAAGRLPDGRPLVLDVRCGR
jgi:hypothetical protein